MAQLFRIDNFNPAAHIFSGSLTRVHPPSAYCPRKTGRRRRIRIGNFKRPVEKLTRYEYRQEWQSLHFHKDTDAL